MSLCFLRSANLPLWHCPSTVFFARQIRGLPLDAMRLRILPWKTELPCSIRSLDPRRIKPFFLVFLSFVCTLMGDCRIVAAALVSRLFKGVADMAASLADFGPETSSRRREPMLQKNRPAPSPQICSRAQRVGAGLPDKSSKRCREADFSGLPVVPLVRPGSRNTKGHIVLTARDRAIALRYRPLIRAFAKHDCPLRMAASATQLTLAPARSAQCDCLSFFNLRF